MMMRVSFSLLAAVTVALRESGEDNSISIGGTKSTVKAAPINQSFDFGDSPAFTTLITVAVLPENLQKFETFRTKVMDELRENAPGVLMSYQFESEANSSLRTLVFVWSDKDALIGHTKTPGFSESLKMNEELGVQVQGVKFLGDPMFTPDDIEDLASRVKLPSNTVIWPNTAGFARQPSPNEVKGDPFVVEMEFYVPNKYVPIINVLNTAFIATQFDWDPTTYFARICVDQEENENDEMRFTYGGIHTLGSRTVELGEGKTEENWALTAAQHGLELIKMNIYGNVSQTFKDKAKAFAGDLVTFWNPAFGFNRW